MIYVVNRDVDLCQEMITMHGETSEQFPIGLIAEDINKSYLKSNSDAMQMIDLIKKNNKSFCVKLLTYELLYLGVVCDYMKHQQEDGDFLFEILNAFDNADKKCKMLDVLYEINPILSADLFHRLDHHTKNSILHLLNSMDLGCLPSRLSNIQIQENNIDKYIE